MVVVVAAAVGVGGGGEVLAPLLLLYKKPSLRIRRHKTHRTCIRTHTRALTHALKRTAQI